MCRIDGEKVITLYRGLSNIYQLEKILEYKTAGGLKSGLSCSSCGILSGCNSTIEELSFLDLDINKFEKAKMQSGTEGERMPRVVYIEDNSRFVTEYTCCESIAKHFGIFAYIKIQIKAKYTEAIRGYIPKPREYGIYCMSCGPYEELNLYKRTSIGTLKTYEQVTDIQAFLKNLYAENKSVIPKI